MICCCQEIARCVQAGGWRRGALPMHDRRNADPVSSPPLSPHARKKYKLDTLGFARRALRMRSGCDASTSSCRTHARERQRAFAFCSLHLAAERRVACLLSENTRVLSLRRLLRQAKRQPPFCIKDAADIVWTHWGLNPGPSACKADVIPLHHVPICGSNPDACDAIGILPSAVGHTDRITICIAGCCLRMLPWSRRVKPCRRNRICFQLSMASMDVTVPFSQAY